MAKNKQIAENIVCSKNDIIELDITDIGNDGEGIGKYKGYTLFVKDALAGDKIKAKVMKTRKHFGFARLMEIISPSVDRVEPLCPVATKCGGCQLQHCSYAKQLDWKREKIENCLKRIGGQDITVEPTIGMEKPLHYRNKAQFPVGRDKDGNIIAGFYAGRTHQIVENTDCIIQHPCCKQIVEEILSFMKENDISPYNEVNHDGLVRHILIRVGVFTGEVMVCLVINGKEIPCKESLVEKICNVDLSQKGDTSLRVKSICININEEKTNAILGKDIKVLYGRGYIEDYIGDIKYQISPLSFYQVNPIQTKKLYQTALGFCDLKGGETVWDLYCGIGTISLFLAKKAKKVCGVEIVLEAIEDAKNNARINNIDNATFFAGAAEDVVPMQYKLSDETLRADVVVVDPPRKGCDEKLLDTVVKMSPEKIVYVSCDPATLARDVKFLSENGYDLKRARGCDMFGMSHHVETVCLLSKKP